MWQDFKMKSLWFTLVAVTVSFFEIIISSNVYAYCDNKAQALLALGVSQVGQVLTPTHNYIELCDFFSYY